MIDVLCLVTVVLSSTTGWGTGTGPASVLTVSLVWYVVVVRCAHPETAVKTAAATVKILRCVFMVVSFVQTSSVEAPHATTA
jgi:hypothetical protein